MPTVLIDDAKKDIYKESAKDRAFGEMLVKRFKTYYDSFERLRNEYRLNVEYRAGNQLQKPVVREKGEMVKVAKPNQGEYDPKTGQIKPAFTYVENANKKTITQREDLEERGYSIGNIENHIAPVLNSLEGAIRQGLEYFDVVGLNEDADAIAKEVQLRLELARRVNKLDELDAICSRDLVEGGVMIQKVYWGFNSEVDRYEARVSRVPLSRVAWNPDMRDTSTFSDMTFFGCIYDLPIEILLELYATDEDGNFDRDKLNVLKAIYDYDEDDKGGMDVGYTSMASGVDAYMETDASVLSIRNSFSRVVSAFGSRQGRVYDIWRREARDIWRIEDPNTGEIIPTFMTDEELKELNDHIEAHNRAEKLQFEQSLGLLHTVMGEEYAKEIQGQIEQSHKPRPKFEKKSKRREYRWINYQIAEDGTILSRHDNSVGVQSPNYIIQVLNEDDGLIQNFVKPLRDLNDQISTVQAYIDKQIELASVVFIDYDVDGIPEESFGGTSGKDNYEKTIREQFRKGQVITPYSSSASSMDDNGKGRSSTIKAYTLALNNLQFLQGYYAQKQALIERLTGITSSNQGYKPDSGTPASRYAMEIQQGALSTSFINAKVNQFRRTRDMFLMQTIQEYEDSNTQVSYDSQEGYDYYNAAEARDLRFELTESSSAKSATSRFASEQTLWQLVTAQVISVDEFMEESQLPEVIRIRNARKQKQAEMAQAQEEQMAQGMPMDGASQQAIPQGMPPQGMPPQGMPPQGMPPQGMPQGMPTQ